MTQNINKGNLVQAGKQANLSPAQMDQINAVYDMYSTHVNLNNLPPAVGAVKFAQLDVNKQVAIQQFFGSPGATTAVATPVTPGSDKTPGRGFIGEALYLLSRPVVVPVKAAFNAMSWASDQVTRGYRAGAIAMMEQMNPADAWTKAGANGEMVFNTGRMQKIQETYGDDITWVAKQIAAGIPQDKIIATAQNENQKRLAFAAGSKEGDPLIEEAVAKVNAAKYSPGRQLANLFLPEDLEGKGGIYKWISGTADAAFRIRTDPTLLLGKARKAYLSMNYALDKTIGTAAKVEQSFSNPKIYGLWDEYTKNLDELNKAREAGQLEKIGELTGKLRILGPGFTENGVDQALTKFAKSDFGGILNVNTAKAFLSDAERITPLFYGQPGFQIKVMPILTPARRAKVNLYTQATRTFDLNKDSADFVRNVVFDEADIQGITGLEAVKTSLMGRAGETAVQAGARTAERIKTAEELKYINKFSIAGINKRIDSFTRKFSTMPDMMEIGDVASDKSALQVERYAKLVYGRYSARIIGDAYRNADVGQRIEMAKGLQSAVGELRGLRGTQGGRKLLDSIGNLNRDAQYSNRVYDELHPEGFVPSAVDGADSALYPSQLNNTISWITPKQLDRYAGRDTFLAKMWGSQYSQAADDVVGTYTTGTLFGPRFPVRNAVEDYIFYLANGEGVFKSALNMARVRRIATTARTTSKDLNLGMVNRLVKKADKEKILAKLDDIDSNIVRSVDDAGNEIITKGAFESRAAQEEAKRKVLAEIFLRNKFNDAQRGEFGNDFDKFVYELINHGDIENLLRIGTEGAQNMTAGADVVSRATRLSGRHGKVVDFKWNGEEYAAQHGSFVDLSPISQEGKVGWAFQIAQKANDELGSQAMRLLSIYGDDKAKFAKSLAAWIDENKNMAKLKPQFSRYADQNYTSTQHAAAVYDDIKALFSRNDGTLNKEFLNKFLVRTPAGELRTSVNDFNLEWLPTDVKDLPKSIVGPRLLPVVQSRNIISDLVSRGWSWLGEANARLSRDQITLDATFKIRKELEPYRLDLQAKIGKEAADAQIIKLSQDLAVERVLNFVDNPEVRSQMAWSMRNFARFYRATEDAYRRAYRTLKYNPEGLRKIALTYEGVSHSGFVQRDDQGEPYFIYPGLAPVYNAVNKMLGAFGLGDKFVAPMPLQFGASLKMLTPSADPQSWLPTFSGPLSGLSLSTIYSIAGFASKSSIAPIAAVGEEIRSTKGLVLGQISESQAFWEAALPGHVNRFLNMVNQDERDSQYASAFRKAVTYLEAAGYAPDATATPGQLADYQKRLRATITGILTTRFALGFVAPAQPAITLKSDMAKWVRENGRVNFKQVFSKLVDEYRNTPDPVGRAMADWVKYYPDQVPYTINESNPVIQARFKTSNEASNWIDANKELLRAFPEGAGFLIPQDGKFTWDAYQFLKDNGYRQNKLVGDYLKEIFVSNDKQYFYTQQDVYESALASAASDTEKRRINAAWQAWSKEYKSTRPLLQEEFANSAANNIKRQAAYTDLKNMLEKTKINTPSANVLRQMVSIYENYLVAKDTMYNSQSQRDIQARDDMKASTLQQLKSLAETNPNANGAFNVLFANFLRG